MKTHLLLPYTYKKIGWLVLITATVLGILFVFIYNYEIPFLNCTVFSLFPDKLSGVYTYANIITTNITQTLIGILIIIGGGFIIFSKEKSEDEFIEYIRMTSLMWAVLVHFIFLIVAFIFIYDIAFLSVMVYNLFTIIYFFIFRFYYLLLKNKIQLRNEK